jgi:protein-ribulosamine 3-kinase
VDTTISTSAFAAIASGIADALGITVQPQPTAHTHGGCINESYRWDGSAGPLFVKVAGVERLGMLAAEAAGLHELAAANAVRIPRVLATGAAADHAYLVLEWIELGASSPAAAGRLGEQLARQHGVRAAQFGWHRDNTIGSTPQINGWTPDWPEFFRERRLRFQLDLARANGHDGRLQQRGMQLLASVREFFTSHQVMPSLLHGDLWGGNWGVDANDAPVLFDPAVYFGDREADIAMTRLFGGFGAEFHAAYAAHWPLDVGAAVRADLYNLYHVLNHLNLFGAGYLRQAESMLDRLLAELGH